MQWFPTTTERDYAQQHLVNEAMRHERRAREDSMVGWIETTPANEQIPQRSIAQLRTELLMEDVGEVKRIWRGRRKLEKPVEDEDSIPM